MVSEKYRQGLRSPDFEVSEQIFLAGISNGDLYRQRIQPMVTNLARKKIRGVYQKDLGVKLFVYLVDAEVQDFRRTIRNHRDYIPERISAAIKNYTAAKFLEYYEEEIEERVESLKAAAEAKKQLRKSQQKIKSSQKKFE
jgi:hypothetical protein